MTSVGPEIIRRDARPPIAMEAAPSSGPTEVTQRRRTAVPRPSVVPRLLPAAGPGLDPTDREVRRLWAHVIGPGAVADLMRLRRAAQRGVSLREPLHLRTLVREGLAHHSGRQVIVLDALPELSATHVRRLPPRIRSKWGLTSD